MDAYGEVLRAIRDRRAITQPKLAQLAGVSEATVRKAEIYPDRPIKRSTKIALMQALHRLAPLTEQESAQYVQAAGLQDLVRGIGQASSATSRMAEAVRAMSPPGVADLRRLIEALPREERGAHFALMELIEQAGPDRAEALIRAALSISRTAEEHHRRFVVQHPSVQRDGYVERVETEYEVREEKPGGSKKRRAQ